MLLKLIKAVIRFVRWVISISVTLVLIAAGIYIYARYIEPELLIIKEEKLVTQSISIPKDTLKIVQFSDVHLGEDFAITDLKRVVERINGLKPI